MPIHDWKHVDAGIFHHFHQAWTIEISNALNGGGLPPGFFAMAEQVVGGTIPDVITLQRSVMKPAREGGSAGDGGGIAVANAPPRTRFTASVEQDAYAARPTALLSGTKTIPLSVRLTSP